MGLDHVIGELMYQFQGRGNNIIYDLGEICLGENAKTDQFEKVSKFYNLNSELEFGNNFFFNMTIDFGNNFFFNVTIDFGNNFLKIIRIFMPKLRLI